MHVCARARVFDNIGRKNLTLTSAYDRDSEAACLAVVAFFLSARTSGRTSVKTSDALGAVVVTGGAIGASDEEEVDIVVCGGAAVKKKKPKKNTT